MTQKATAVRRIEHLIQENRSRQETRLPTEKQLMEQLGVGRNTLRSAIEHLEKRGLIRRIQGKGTFISEPDSSLVFSSWIPSEVPSQPSFDRYAETFSRKHGRITVQGLSFPYDFYTSRVRRHVMSGGHIDVIQLNPYWLRRFYHMDALLSLEHYVGPHQRSLRYTQDLDSCRINGELFAINWTLAPLVMYYNKRMLKGAGIDPEKPPGTLDELYDMCRRINQQGDGSYFGICFPDRPHESNVMWLYPFLRAFGGGFMDEIGSLILGSEENAAALSWLYRLLKHGGTQDQKTIAETRIAFASGDSAFIVDGSYGRGFIEHMSDGTMTFGKDYGICTIPRGFTGRSESTLLSHSLSISATTPDPDLAYKWIEFLCNDEENARNYYHESGMIPATRDLLQKPYFQEDPFASVLVQQIHTAAPGRIDHPVFASALPFLSTVFGQIITGQKSVDEGFEFLHNVMSVLNSADVPWA